MRGADGRPAHDDRPSSVQSRAILAVTGLLLAFPAVGLTVLSGASLREPGLDRFGEGVGGLVAVTACAIGAGVCLREAAGTRARWPWLCVALLAPAWYVATAIGV